MILYVAVPLVMTVIIQARVEWEICVILGKSLLGGIGWRGLGVCVDNSGIHWESSLCHFILAFP